MQRSAIRCSPPVSSDVSGLLRYEYDLKKAGDMMMDVIYDTVNGRLCKAEVMGHREFTFTKLYISA